MINEHVAVSNILNSYCVTMAEITGYTDIINSCTGLRDTLQTHNHDSYVILKTIYVPIMKYYLVQLYLPNRCIRG